MYANIIVDISHEKLDKPFQYLVPPQMEEKIAEGMRVSVPFGNRTIAGYVVELTENPEYDVSKIKPVLSIIKGAVAIESQLIALAAWMRRQYGGTMNQALKTVLPIKRQERHREKKQVCLAVSKEQAASLHAQCQKKHHAVQARLLAELLECTPQPYEHLSKDLGISLSVIRNMEQKGIVRMERFAAYRNPALHSPAVHRNIVLNAEQQEIAARIIREFDAGKRCTYLLHGVTGSGKTEVYLALIAHACAKGHACIMLIPEIALTFQTMQRFYERFGSRVSVLHSRMSPGERYDQFERAKNGDIDIMIGPRSALFTPFSNLGLIIMDEEHENSYKSESMPRYHARETAIQIASLKGAGVLLGSATPSLEAYYRAAKGEYKLYRLNERLTGGCLPRVYTVDLREELKNGNRSIFSRKLKELMEERLAAGEQIMLFLNRRGYAGFISCRACGHVMKCPHCDVSLSEHRNGMLICHYCGHEEKKPKLCPSCGSKYLLGFKAGTQQIEEAVHKEFPEAAVLRMDADSTRKKESYEQILSAFADGKADILVGTQMIVKGHDFPNVTLVGILAADLSLNQNDYRAGERTFQLLTQAAGRAGRGERPGEVVIQTYQPEHYSIIHAAGQDYESFYEEEITYRELLQYPPAAHMLAVMSTAKEEKQGETVLSGMAGCIRDRFGPEKGLYIIGPAPAAVSKINDLYRHTLYFKHSDYEKLVQIKDMLETYMKEHDLKNQNVQFDFDPMNTF